MHTLERKQSVEVSSFRVASKQSQDLKERYKEIKTKNEYLKAQTYGKYMKMGPTNKTRLMFAFDIK